MCKSIKTNELMIGDLVKSFEPIRIEAVYRHSVSDSSMVKHSELDIEPIPLTIEILEKNGFIYDRDERYVNWDIDLAVRYDRGFFILWERVTLHYVHELQHALRLCGLNELADNFEL